MSSNNFNLKRKQILRLTTLQFGLVHHFTKLGSGEYYLEELEHEVGVLLRYWVSGTGLGSGYCTATVSQNNTEVQKFKILCVCGPFDPWTLSARRAHIWHKGPLTQGPSARIHFLIRALMA